MKYILIGCLLLLTCFSGLQAQNKGKDKDKDKLSKEDEKRIKERKKSMDPMDFKELYEGYGRLKKETTNLQRRVENMGKQLTDKESEISVLKQQLDSLRSAAAIGTAELAGGEDYSKGLVYKVQVGDIKETRLDREFLEKAGEKELAVEKDENGKLKYTLGYFRDYWEAQAFKDYLIKIGVKMAYVVAYKDGKYTGMKEAREMDSSGNK